MRTTGARQARATTLLVAAVLVAVHLAVLGTLGAAPAHAVTTFTWKGTESSAWGTPKNWDPEGIPQNGDAVVLGPVGPSGRATLSGVPDITLSALTVSGDPDELVSMTGDGSVLVGNLQWTGGDIDVDLTVSAPPLDPNPSVISPSDTPLRFGGGARTLTLLSNVEMPVGLGAGAAPWLTFMFDSSLRIGGTSTLRLDPAAHLAANRCCSGRTSTVVVDGTLEVFSITGATGFTARLEQLGLDVAGTIDVPVGNTLEVTGGPVRVGSTPLNGTLGAASLRGGGVVHLVETDGSGYDEQHPDEPDSTMKFLDADKPLTLGEDTTLRLGDFATVSDVGTIDGTGTVLLAGPDVIGELTLADGVRAATVPGTTSRLVHYDEVRGQHGLLVPRGGLDVVPGSTLMVNRGTRVLVPGDARLDVAAGAVVASDGCCNDPGQVVVHRDGTLALGEGPTTAAPTVLRWVELGGAGELTHAGHTEWDLAGTAFTSGASLTGSGVLDGDLPAGALTVRPTGVLEVTGDYVPNAGGTYVATVPTSRSGTATDRLEVGGTARLAGRLVTEGTTRFPAGRTLAALAAGVVDGRFRCAHTPGFLARYSSGSVALRAIEAADPGCLVEAAGRVVKARFKGSRRVDLGVPTGAARVLLHVTLGRADRRHTLTLSSLRGSSVTVRAAARRTTRQYVVLDVATSRRLLVRSSRKAQVTVARVGWS